MNDAQNKGENKMKKAIRIWVVEYDFINTKWGMGPMYMRSFNTEAEANEFAKTKSDANVIWLDRYEN